jgi:predicted nuclease with TOPRIM domain
MACAISTHNVDFQLVNDKYCFFTSFSGNFMQAKKMGYFLSTLLLFSGLICSVGASTTTVSFRGGGVTIDLTFPEEAHPTDSIWHNATITANTALYLRNFTVVIKAPVNSGWQVVFIGKDETNRYLSANATLQWSMQTDPLPQEANGKLSCFMHVNTSQSTDYSSYTFYTTHVSEPTFSEMQSLYYEMLANYTTLQTDYETLLNEYDGLLANYSSLFANYTTLLSEHNELLVKYNAQVATYESLLNSYNKLSGDYNTLDSNYRSQLSKYNALQVDYDSLNSTHYSLQANYTSLQAVYKALNQTYIELETELNDLQQRNTFLENAQNTDRIVMFIFVVTVACLIALIIYIKKKEPEPYVVIRKETVAMKPDEKS